jgi:hypothetical protein
MKKNNVNPLFLRKKVVGTFETTKSNQSETSRWCQLFGL